MPNKWIEHVKDYQNKHGCSYRHALSHAKETYMTGSGNKNSGYIRRLIAEKNEEFDINKMKKPSEHIITHFSSPSQEETYENEGYSNSDNEEPAPKPIRKKKVKKGMKEVDLERIEAQRKKEADELLKKASNMAPDQIAKENDALAQKAYELQERAKKEGKSVEDIKEEDDPKGFSFRRLFKRIFENMMY